MNILFLNFKREWTGPAAWMVIASEGLRNRGHDAWTLSSTASKHYVRDPHKEWLVPSPPRSKFDPRTLQLVLRLVKEHQIDVIVANSPREIILGGLAGKLCRVPVVRRIGLAKDLLKNGKHKFLHQIFVQRSIVPAEDVKREILERFTHFDPDKFAVIHNGRATLPSTPDSRASERESLGIPPEAFVFGCNARLNVQKRHDGTIRAFAEIAKMAQNAHLVLTGEGGRQEELETLALVLGLADRIHFPGYTTEPMKRCHAYDVYVSNSEHEGFPNAIVEAMGTGLPVIATNVNGTGEIVRDEENGLLIPFGDHEALVHAMRRMIEDSALRTRLGDEALKIVSERFSDSKMIDSIEQVLHLAIECSAFAQNRVHEKS